jgi:hypothetical protein
MYIHICYMLHIHTYVHICTYTCIYMHMHIHVHVHTHTHYLEHLEKLRGSPPVGAIFDLPIVLNERNNAGDIVQIDANL